MSIFWIGRITIDGSIGGPISRVECADGLLSVDADDAIFNDKHHLILSSLLDAVPVDVEFVGEALPGGGAFIVSSVSRVELGRSTLIRVCMLRVQDKKGAAHE